MTMDKLDELEQRVIKQFDRILENIEKSDKPEALAKVLEIVEKSIVWISKRNENKSNKNPLDEYSIDELDKMMGDSDSE